MIIRRPLKQTIKWRSIIKNKSGMRLMR
jgi:hypothetical protein